MDMKEGSRIIIRNPDSAANGAIGVYLHPDYYSPDTRSVVRLDRTKHFVFSYPNWCIRAVTEVQ